MTQVWDAFQKALYECLTTDTTLMAMLKGDGIYDYVDASIGMPFVNIGDDALFDWDDKTKDGTEIHAMIHVWSDKEGAGEGKEIASRIRARLRSTLLSMDATCRYRVIDPPQMQGPAKALREDNNRIYHVVMQFKFLIEEF